jgi:hypothetical protein
MACNCGGSAAAASYIIPGENYGIYGYLPTSSAMELDIGSLFTVVALIGGMGLVAYMATSGATRKKAKSRRR